MVLGVFVTLVIVTLVSSFIGIRYALFHSFNVIHIVLVVFLSVNLLICHWELCLFYRRHNIQARAEHWRQRLQASGRSPAAELFLMRVPVKRILSLDLWVDVWAAYSYYDESYADVKTFGYSADVANGFSTLIPSVFLALTFSTQIIPATYVGIVGIMVFWQWVYVTSVYWGSFFVAERQGKLQKWELYIFIFGLNSFWILSSLLGLYVSLSLIISGDYSVLGY